MQQRVQVQKTAVKRIDVAVREQEAAEHAEVLSKARRASKHAHRATALAMQLVDEIERMI